MLHNTDRVLALAGPAKRDVYNSVNMVIPVAIVPARDIAAEIASAMPGIPQLMSPAAWRTSTQEPTSPGPLMMLRFGDVAMALDDDWVSSDVESVVLFADLAQDYVFDRLAIAWPQCPGHVHPAEVVRNGERAVWHCPATKAIISEVGYLGGTATL